MKKTVALFLLVLYTATTFGVTLKFHYCGDKLDQVSIFNSSDKVACSCGPGAMPKGCCKDKTVRSQIDHHDKFVESASVNEFSIISHLPFFIDFSNLRSWKPIKSEHYAGYQVKRLALFPIYLSIRSLRI